MSNAKLNIGISDFQKLRTNPSYYIDKSLFIKDVIDNSHEVLLITRPRRFGKTLNMSMLQYFFEAGENRRELFNGLAIEKDPIFDRHFGKYPVIFLTFKDIKNNKWKDSFEGITKLIQAEFGKYQYLLDWKELPTFAVKMFTNIIQDQASKRDYEDSLKVLSEQLHKYHKTPAVILIDEYDTPIHNGYINDFYDRIDFMRNLLSGAFKDNAHLFKGVITGALRISKESIFTGFNNPGVYTILDKKFNTSFGFTKDEVKQLLVDFDLSDHYDTIAEWYDGYLFGQELIFNPWSVLNYIDASDQEPQPYWINTGGTDLIEQSIAFEIQEELLKLITGETIDKTIEESIIMQDIESGETDFLWTFLLHTGYLKASERIPSKYELKYKLAIPNHEVNIAFRHFIRRWFKRCVKIKHLESMLTSLTNQNIVEFEKHLSEIVSEIMSYHDFAKSPEAVYHALVLGMLVWLSDDYVIRSNRESGLGRYDMMFQPKSSGKAGIIIEFKELKKGHKPETTLDKALKQIDKKKYITELKNAGVKDILKLAIVFRSKEVWVKKA